MVRTLDCSGCDEKPLVLVGRGGGRRGSGAGSGKINNRRLAGGKEAREKAAVRVQGMESPGWRP